MGNRIMNIAYKEKIRTMKRNFKSGIFKKDPRPYVMLLVSHFIAYTIFPCIIIYKHEKNNQVDKNSRYLIPKK